MDVPFDASAQLDEIHAGLPLQLRSEFERERDTVLARLVTAKSYADLSVFLVKWREVAEAEARETGTSRRMLAITSEFVLEGDHL